MKSVWLMLAMAALCGQVVAATSQQDRMKSCNAQAGEKNLAGEQRKEFMSRCLSTAASAASAPAPAAHGAAAKSGETKRTAQHAKMKTCNADAKTKNLKGEPRKKFMSQCLKA
jgi:hypothetical protein